MRHRRYECRQSRNVERKGHSGYVYPQPEPPATCRTSYRAEDRKSRKRKRGDTNRAESVTGERGQLLLGHNARIVRAESHAHKRQLLTWMKPPASTSQPANHRRSDTVHHADRNATKVPTGVPEARLKDKILYSGLLSSACKSKKTLERQGRCHAQG